MKILVLLTTLNVLKINVSHDRACAIMEFLNVGFPLEAIRVLDFFRPRDDAFPHITRDIEKCITSGGKIV